ncbi:T9SS type A sorting domain-containing protein [Aquimarina agarivorans]|uniref:T9SS type A sorting domain-containing protein n=1 Tax=Aquimarina agarivorans TaxID=980584 RepID=UPI000248EB81|nr:T9SS type A sorting domain-containing protein [Aquimarina agarivorans]
MKKITLLLASLVTSVAFSQSISISPIPSTIEIGDVISIDVTYDKGGLVMDYMDITLRQLNEAGDATIFDASPIFPAAPGDTGMITVDYTIQAVNSMATFPDSFDGMDLETSANLSEGSYVMFAFMQLDTGMVDSMGNPIKTFPSITPVPVTIVEANTLSNNNFSKDNIASAISQEPGKINISTNVETDTYKLYDLSGAVVVDKPADGSIDVSALPSGVYIIATDSGLAKVAF